MIKEFGLYWELKPLYLEGWSNSGYFCKYRIERKRHITLDTSSKLNGEKWWRLYSSHSGLPFTSWRSGRWLGVLWRFDNEEFNQGEIK